MVGKGCIHVIQMKYILKSEMSEIINVTTNAGMLNLETVQTLRGFNC